MTARSGRRLLLVVLLWLCACVVAQETVTASEGQPEVETTTTSATASAEQACSATDETCLAEAAAANASQKDDHATAATDVTVFCADNHSQCPDWAEEGECDENPTYMKGNCRKSCDQCSRYVCWAAICDSTVVVHLGCVHSFLMNPFFPVIC